MKKLLFFSVFFLWLASICFAQQWSQTAGPGGDFLQTTAINKQGDIFAVRAALHRSTDGGKTWKRIFQEAPINSIASLIVQPSGRLIAQIILSVDNYRNPSSGQLFFSDDNGDSWQQFPIHGFQLWQGAKNEVFSVDSNMKFIRTVDDGNNWTHIDTTGVPDHLISAASDDAGNIFLISAGLNNNRLGFLYRSSDNGTSWSKIVNGIDPLTTVVSFTKGHLFAYDKTFNYHGLYHSADNGRTWKWLKSDRIVGVLTNNSKEALICGPDNFYIYRYDANGDSLILQQSEGWNQFGNVVRTVSFSLEPTGDFIISARLGTFRLNLKDISLSERINIPSDKVTAIITRPNNEIVAFAGGDSLFSWHSTDQGASWDQDKWANYRQYRRTITQMCLDSIDNIIAGYLGKIIRSPDDGINWGEISGFLTTDAPYYYEGSFSGLLTNSEGSIFVSSLADGIFRSTDNGSTWDQLNKGITDHSLSSLALARNGDLYTGGKNTIYRSTDNALNWSPLKTNFPTSAKSVTAIVENVQGNLIAAIDSIGIFWSTDKGLSWIKHSIGFTARKVNSFLSTPSGKVFAATDSGVFYLDTTAGANWTPYNLGLTALSVLCMCIDKKGKLYLGTDVSGVFSSIETFGGPSTNDVTQTTATSEITLGASCPNPTSSSTTIPFTLGKSGTVLLEVIDQLGKTVATLTNKFYTAGEYSIVFDAKELKIGIYYLRLQGNGKTLIAPLGKIK
ncbi:MAG TPA: T9SS type A sorting domain-containing protein [Candidatus Kapabacteria bacterium]|nr:T9SS type A sorting domain-containing protein [Candidatus Kapabacteria bacterium]